MPRSVSFIIVTTITILMENNQSCKEIFEAVINYEKKRETNTGLPYRHELHLF